MDRRKIQPQTTIDSLHSHNQQGDVYIPPKLVWNTQAHGPEREWLLHPKILRDSYNFICSLCEEINAEFLCVRREQNVSLCRMIPACA